jgi:uncharacterized protein (UPF0303 family)
VNEEAPLKALEAQEAALVFDSFDEHVAMKLGMAALALAESRGQSVWINVSRGLHTLFEFSMPGTAPMNADFGRRKRSVVNLMHFSSARFYLDKLNGFNWVEFMGLDPREFGTHAGCVPIRVSNAGVVGSMTISGLSDIDDHNMVVEIMNAHLGTSAAPLSL